MDEQLLADALAVLAELVACEELKARVGPDAEEYERRCLPAWIAARKVLQRAQHN